MKENYVKKVNKGKLPLWPLYAISNAEERNRQNIREKKVMGKKDFSYIFLVDTASDHSQG